MYEDHDITKTLLRFITVSAAYLYCSAIPPASIKPMPAAGAPSRVDGRRQDRRLSVGNRAAANLPDRGWH